MANAITLDSIRESVEKKYAPVKIEVDAETTVELRNILRLSKNERKKVTAALEELEGLTENEDDMTEDDIQKIVSVMGTVISTVANGNARKLITALGDDIPVIMQVLETWQAGTQSGEANSSPA